MCGIDVGQIIDDSDEGFERYIAALQAKQDAALAVLQDALDAGVIEFRGREDRALFAAAVTRDLLPHNKGKMRVTRFDEQGLCGHAVVGEKGIAWELYDLGMVAPAPGIMDKLALGW